MCKDLSIAFPSGPPECTGLVSLNECHVFGRFVQLYFATKNPHKLAEARAGLAAHEVVQLDVEKVEIRSDRLDEIARFAAQRIRETFERPFFVEDSGIFVDELNGFPGPYSSGIYNQIGLEGLHRLLKGASSRAATFRSVVAFSRPGEEIVSLEGDMQGSIAQSPRGSNGFDYDPLFIPDEGDGRTYGEMTLEEKNAFSHRGRALARLDDHLRATSK